MDLGAYGWFRAYTWLKIILQHEIREWKIINDQIGPSEQPSNLTEHWDIISFCTRPQSTQYRLHALILFRGKKTFKRVDGTGKASIVANILTSIWASIWASKWASHWRAHERVIGEHSSKFIGEHKSMYEEREQVQGCWAANPKIPQWFKTLQIGM